MPARQIQFWQFIYFQRRILMADEYIDEGICPHCRAHLQFRRYGYQLCGECGNRIYVKPDSGSNGFLNFLANRPRLKAPRASPKPFLNVWEQSIGGEILDIDRYIQELKDFLIDITAVGSDLAAGAIEEINRLTVKRTYLADLQGRLSY